MLAFIIDRLATAALVLACVSVIAFSLVHLRGDPARLMAGETAQPADIEILRKAYGLDQPIAVQYAKWALLALQGDFGSSIHYKRPVSELIAEVFPITLILAFSALMLAIAIAVPLGVAAGCYPNSFIDRVSLVVGIIGQAVPSFWLGLMLMIVLGVNLRWLPISGSSTWQHFVMPVLVLTTYAIPLVMRLTRAGMIEALGSDYIRTAWAKGLLPLSIVWKHALRNALLPVFAVSAVQLGALLSGSVVTETVFNLRGIGWLSYDSLTRADLPVIQAVVLIVAAIYVVLTTLADVLSAWTDPRIRLS
jgi:peptide/nickel transport system permease protein